MKWRNPGDRYACPDCNHILASYIDYEHHRAYFHDKDIEKVLVPECKSCGLPIGDKDDWCQRDMDETEWAKNL